MRLRLALAAGTLAALAALATAPAAAARTYAFNGVALGASEAAVKARFPSAHCRALEWQSEAAERRCDDARVSIAGVDASVTFYLKADAVQAFDLRFNTRDLERVLAHFKSLYGEPASEGSEELVRAGRPPRELFKARWRAGADRAVLSSQRERKRSELNVWRGKFAQEIYKVR